MSVASFSLETAPQFDFLRTVPSHGWLMLAPFRWDADNKTLHYVYQTDSGDVQRLQISAVENVVHVDLADCQELRPALHAAFARAVKRMLNMDWDLAEFYAAMRSHAGYDWLERERRGRILISPSLWEDLAKVLLTTNTGWAHTVAMSQRLCQLGAAHPTIDGCHAFPTPQRIAEMEIEELKKAVNAGYRTAHLHELARKISENEIKLDAWLAFNSDELCNAVKSLKGFGDYAARTIAAMYGHFDKIAIDSGCRNMFAALHNRGVKAEDKAIFAYYEKFGSWRGLALWFDNMRYYENAE